MVRPELRWKVAGIALCAAGGLMLSYAALRYAAGSYRAAEARQLWEQYEARRLVASSRAQAGESAFPEAAIAGAPVARLVIPRIRLDEIVLEGVGGSELNAAPGHLPGSALPGMVGNAVISAHRDRHFDRLGEVQLGDTITTESGQYTTTWVVVARRIVGHATPALFQTKEPLLTLTTCWPIRYFGTAPERLIISARQAAKPGDRASERRGISRRT